jgi:hypothetical protein
VISEGPTCVGSKVWAFPSRQQMTSAFVFLNPLFFVFLVFFGKSLENWVSGSGRIFLRCYWMDFVCKIKYSYILYVVITV